MRMKKDLDESAIKDKIDRVSLNQNPDTPAASVIIVTHNTNRKLLSASIGKLKNDTGIPYEILLIDNNEVSHLGEFAKTGGISYIKLKRNYGLNTGRNVGTLYAAGKVLIFLDDDAIPGDNFVQEHVNVHESDTIHAVRGRCLPLTNSVFNHLALHYDLGNDTIPYCVNLEGNSSFKKNVLLEVGGFNSALKGAGGHEGLEISKRILEKTNDENSVIYWPGAVIYHDYSKSLIHYLKKQVRHEKHIEYIAKNHPDFLNFYRSYKPVIIKDERELDYITRRKLDMIRRLHRRALRPNSIINKIINYL